MLEKYQSALKVADDDETQDIIDSFQKMEKQLQQHYELACKKAEMQHEQRADVLKRLDSITADLQRLVLLEFWLVTESDCWNQI